MEENEEEQLYCWLSKAIHFPTLANTLRLDFFTVQYINIFLSYLSAYVADVGQNFFTTNISFQCV